ncbi:hypothetical protein TIFTF001_031990 [Ficus carica]|uniref:Uncharacterized protein n=1 Tax=Ficus carica TaxID=3494 RepID=A0AA88J1T5_FICCA|nr:hypothetical protein TIFTF001_031990 [Ficus carica]
MVIRFWHCFRPPWKRSISKDGDKINLLNLKLSISFGVTSGNIFEWRRGEDKISSGEIDLLRRNRSPHQRSWLRAHGGMIWLSADSCTTGEEIIRAPSRAMSGKIYDSTTYFWSSLSAH